MSLPLTAGIGQGYGFRIQDPEKAGRGEPEIFPAPGAGILLPQDIIREGGTKAAQ